jgi:hypothetical protein
MPQSATPVFRLAVSAPVPRDAGFGAGRLTSDGGLPWLAEAAARVGVCAAFAAVIPEWRRGPVRYSLSMLVRSASSRSPAATKTRTTPAPCAPMRRRPKFGLNRDEEHDRQCKERQ